MVCSLAIYCRGGEEPWKRIARAMEEGVEEVLGDAGDEGVDVTEFKMQVQEYMERKKKAKTFCIQGPAEKRRHGLRQARHAPTVHNKKNQHKINAT